MDIEFFLKELKEHWIQNKIPNISEVNARFLRDLIKIQKTKNMLEIWTANWYSAINFALELKEVWGKLTTIEFSKSSYDTAINNFKLAWVSEIINAINWNALDIIPNLKEKYDFVFIDWMKRRTKDFLGLVRDKVEKWWIIVIDDVVKFREKMIWLWEYLENNKIVYNIIHIDIDDWVIMVIK